MFLTVQCPPVFGTRAVNEPKGCMRKTRRAASNSELIIGRNKSIVFVLKRYCRDDFQSGAVQLVVSPIMTDVN